VPGFTLSGNPAIPEILSDKLILTPPAPGGYRGAIWSEKTLDYDNWIVDVDFRTSGPERGTGKYVLRSSKPLEGANDTDQLQLPA
jgi:lectin, mannose-binding 1